MERDPLRGLGVLVTRPAHQAEPLCRALEARGARVIRFPTLAIAPPPDADAVERGIDRLAAMDWVVFVSPNAARSLLDRLAARGEAWPDGVRVATVGAGTAAELEARGVAVDCVPAAGSDSEALLDEPAFRHVDGQRAMLVRGESGRETLRTTLAERGARVEVLPAYRRVRPDSDPAVLDRAWARGMLDVAVVTSTEALDNLVGLAGEARRSRLLATGLVVMSERVASRASGLGFAGGIVVADGTGTDALTEAVARWAAENRRQNHP
ncbi:uroporphyrinogen-III synthase [Aquisalimonas lutea]|uniref:uroporphyrinogen-III synthase n=1 Tax=Aquisalimonas lutea TaxID=1327750 RepID=UPI0025B49F43|nr:uroporphyrinogen-III synthase [Aquisalimonas lutea]MDN3516674.1 uroporphyrinogen-III synthase [Aquisalimonas lutea]